MLRSDPLVSNIDIFTYKNDFLLTLLSFTYRNELAQGHAHESIAAFENSCWLQRAIPRLDSKHRISW